MKNPIWYSFTETGFITRSECIYNDSSEFNITQRYPSTATDDGYPDMFMVTGLLPNSNWTAPLKPMHYAQIAWGNSGRIVGIFDQVPRAPDYDNGYYFGITAGFNYGQLNNIQCRVDFEPRHFTVHVSTQNRTINVTSSPEPVNELLDPSHYLRSQALHSTRLSAIITSLYTNAVGDAFLRNVHNMHIRKSLPPGDSYANDTVLEAVAESVSAMMDDAFVALNSYLLMNLNVTKPLTSLVATPAIRIGTRKFVIAGVVLNVVGLIFVFLACLFLARLQVPLFDYNDLGCMALSATRDATCDEAVDAWDGDPKNQILGSVFAKLEVDPVGRPVVILQGDSDIVKK